jgi:hypothetical protein
MGGPGSGRKAGSKNGSGKGRKFGKNWTIGTHTGADKTKFMYNSKTGDMKYPLSLNRKKK